MKQYDAYKSTGIEWIGEVPEHWEKCRFKNFITLITTTSESENKIGLENIESDSGRYIETDSEFEGNGVGFKINDIVYGKLRPYLRKVWKATFAGNAVGDFYVFRSKKSTTPTFVKYLMLSEGFTKITNGSTYGAKMPRVASDFILSMHYYLPPLSEQEAIAKYLDEKCGSIDKVIATQEKRVALLNELKQSVISEAVTRGINPDAQLKDTGIEWIGEIPEHWEVKKISHIYNHIGSGTTPNTGNKDFYCDCGGINWLQTGDLNDGYITNTAKQISSEAVSTLNLKIYPEHSVVIAMYGATIGKVGILDICTTVNQACCVLETSKYMNKKYSFYSFISAKKSLIAQSAGGGQPNISQDVIRRHKMPIPPLSEQEAIAKYLDEKCSRFDILISKANKEIELLKEYKQTVISEAVTGKIKVC